MDGSISPDDKQFGMDGSISPDDEQLASTESVSSELSHENVSDADIKEVDTLSVVETCKKNESEFDLVQTPLNGLADGTFKSKKLNELKGADSKGNSKKELKSDAKGCKPDTSLRKKGGNASLQAVKMHSTRSASLTQSSGKKLGAPVENGITEAVAPSEPPPHKSPGCNLSRSNFTIPQPFALATDRRASVGLQRVPASEAPSQLESHQSDSTTQTPRGSAIKDIQGSRKTASKSNKGLHEEKTKKLEDSDASLEVQKVDNDDVQSESSLTPKATKANSAFALSASTFSFKCDERAEKRKQFYTKLEERHIAKEEEQNQMQEKTDKEMEAEIRELRKSLTFKATPMPAFYKEGTPAKMELKKIPTTRARSPKLGRRSSNGIGTPSLSKDEMCNADESLEKPSVKQNVDTSKKFVRKPLSSSRSEYSSKIKTSERNGKGDLTQAPADTPELNIQTSAGSKVRDTLGENERASPHSDEIAAIPEVSLQGNEKPGGREACMLEMDARSGCMEDTEQMNASDNEADVNAEFVEEDNIATKATAKTNLQDSHSPTHEPASVSTSAGGGGVLHKALKQAVQGIKIAKKEKLKASIPIFRTKKGTKLLAKHSIQDGHGLPQVTLEVAASS